jgi:hypothetical protein
VVKTKNFPKFFMPPHKKGSGAVRKINKTLSGILKRQVLKYPTITIAELQTSINMPS